MSNVEFEEKKQNYLKRKQASLERLEKAIAEAQTETHDGRQELAEGVKRAYASVLAAVDGVRSANESDLDSAVEKADLALSTAFQRLEGKGKVEMS